MLGDTLRIRFWLIALAAATFAAMAYGVTSLSSLTPNDWFVASALVLLLFLVEHYDVKLSVSGGPFSMSIGATIAMAAVLHFPVPIAVMVVLVGHLLDSAVAARQFMKSITNIGTYVCSSFAAGTIYHLLADTSRSPLASIHNIVVAVLASAAFVILSTSILAIIVGPIIGMPFFQLWQENLKTTFVETIGLPALGGIVAVLAQENAGAVLLIGFPLMAPQFAYKALSDARNSVRATVEQLVDTLEQRDRSTADHSRRVADYVEAIVEHMMEVPPQMTDTILWAARVHDLGKIGVRDATLFKAGPLTPAERDEMQTHPVLGAEIVANLAQSEAIAIIIRHHHERWDGKGYPDGLKGEAIPLGSRIIAVADTFEAMTADRPYRRALPMQTAYEEILRHSGTQFDPNVVRAFERALFPNGARNGHGQPTATHGSLSPA